MLLLCAMLAAGLIAGVIASTLVSGFVIVPLLLPALRLLRARLSEEKLPNGIGPMFLLGGFGPSFPRSF